MVIHKIVKKIEWLLDMYEEKFTDNMELKLMKMQFYTVHLANKLKIKAIISEVDYRKLTLQHKLLVFDVN